MAYGVNKPNPGGTSVAPKVQGTNMAPRQQALGRALEKPKPKPDKSVNFNTQFGLGDKKFTGPSYGLSNQDKKPGMDVQGNPAMTPNAPKPNKQGVFIQQPQVAGPAGIASNPLGTGDPELDQYLAGDDVYQSILASIQRNKDMSKTTYDANSANLSTDNATIKRRLAEKEIADNALLDNDYAARGLFGSGLFAKADTDLGNSYSDQYTDLSTTFNRNLQQLLTDQQSQDALDEETKNQAMQDAITRRAQEFGIFGGPSNVTTAGKDGKDGKNGKEGKKGKPGKGKGGKG